MVKSIKLGPKEVSNFSEPFMAVDIGSNHNGDMELCKKMIDAAVESGADAVKFQAFGVDLFSEACYDGDPRQQKLMEEFPYFKKLFTEIHPNLRKEMTSWALTKEMLCEIKDYCDEKRITFFCTPLSNEWADFLVDELNMSFIKVASMDLNNYPFLDYIARKNRPIILSTGLSTMSEIIRAVNTIKDAGNDQIVICHCLAIYPAPAEITNLRNIDMLREYFNLPTGFSYNSPGKVMPIAAVARGACFIEQHFTIDKKLPGWDHAISADLEDMKFIVSSCKQVQKGLGKYERYLSEEEINKRLHFRRSMVINKDLPAGSIVTSNDVTFKRPGGIGIDPGEAEYFLGRKLKRDLQTDDIIRKEYFE